MTKAHEGVDFLVRLVSSLRLCLGIVILLPPLLSFLSILRSPGGILPRLLGRLIVGGVPVLPLVLSSTPLGLLVRLGRFGPPSPFTFAIRVRRLLDQGRRSCG